MKTSETLISELEWRDSVHDVSHTEILTTYLEKEPRVLYCGFDPTADSLHVGSLLPLTMLRRFLARGHHVIVLLGSATGMIGDPSGKSQERTLLEEEVLSYNLEALKKQISAVLSPDTSSEKEHKASEAKITFVSNGDWLSKLTFIEVLRDIGKYISVNYMISKESVKTRLSEREQGISYTEFSYMLLQAYDFYHLFKNERCGLQIGGSDQWGNITAGLDYIKKREGSGAEAFALTFPLLTTSDGKKFGKSESGTVWLDPSRTSAYAFYQFWLNTPDADIGRYLKLFSMREPSDISSVIEIHSAAPEKRIAQKALADELTALIHGNEDLLKATKAASALFTLKPEDLSSETLLTLADEIPTTRLSKCELSFPAPIQDLIVACGAAGSKTAARKLIDNGGVYLNHKRISDSNIQLTEADLIDNKAALIRSGKKNYFLIMP